MFEVNNKNTRTTSLTASSFSIFEFEQVNISWKYEEYNTKPLRSRHRINKKHYMNITAQKMKFSI